MKILIRQPGKPKISLRFPSALLFPLLPHILTHLSGNEPPLSQEEPFFSPEQRRQILHALAHARRQHPHLTLLEVDVSTGEHVEIRW